MNDLYCIWSYEHGAWWKPNRQGYCYRPGEAGLYDFEEACAIMHNANRFGVINEIVIPESIALERGQPNDIYSR